VPVDVANAEATLVKLEIEYRALQAEPGTVAQHRREWLAAELTTARAETAGLRGRWDQQKQMVANIRELIHTEETLRAEEDHARRTGQLDRAGEIAYRAIPEISRRIEELEAQLRTMQTANLMLRDTVVPSDIIAIAASWTGKKKSDFAPPRDDEDY
jgi:ATP-dependent Clp protease ATP-binding subunit ClpB